VWLKSIGILCSEMPKACSLLTTLVIFGISVQDVLQDSTPDVARNKDALDLFCGAAAIHRAAVDSGLASTAFDKFRVPGITDSGRAGLTEDLSSKSGFMRALELVKQLRRGGLLVMGPPCSSFVVLNAKKLPTERPEQLPRRFEIPACSVGELVGHCCCIPDDSSLHARRGGGLRKSAKQYDLEVPHSQASLGFLRSAFHMYTTVRLVDRTMGEAHAEEVQVRLHGDVDF